MAVLLALVSIAYTATSSEVLFPTALKCPDCPTVTVTGIVDGDNLDSSEGRIRLFGVDTPERGQRCSKEATDRLSRLAGNAVRVESGPRATGPFGRSLYYVYTMVGHSIDAVSVRIWPE